MTENAINCNSGETIRGAVRELYGAAARQASGNEPASCCGGGAATTLSSTVKDVISGGLYSDEDLNGLPSTAYLASLGCGNPTALAELKPGQVVLDLGSGGGIDVLLSARRVGPAGFAYGLDMTDEMLELAERNRAEAGVENVKFLKGEIESIPLPDSTVDVIISNCVINLSVDKGKVLAEAARVLRPGGRFAVSDIVFDGELQLPDAARADLLGWSGCIAGALSTIEYEKKLKCAGFVDVQIEATRRYSLADIGQAGFSSLLQTLNDEQKSHLDGRVMSAFVRATLPAKAQPCCSDCGGGNS